MAPAVTEAPVSPKNPQNGDSEVNKSSRHKPLKSSGALDHFSSEETTPILGREYLDLDIVDDLLNADNADERLRDLAIAISQRGVVFFRAQSKLTNELQKQFIQRLGELSGKPSTSTLHVHPIFNNTSEFGVTDAQISVISSAGRKHLFKHELTARVPKKRYESALWHSDIQFETVPADYTSLRLTKLPFSGGDTLWASGYELYDRFSPAYQRFLEGLTATFTGESFIKAAETDPDRVKIHEGPRGNPLNVGRALQAVHPVIRTNPVTGWKSLFAVGSQLKTINELTPDESEELIARFREILERSHDLQVRFKWRNENDIAIWDNRSVFHCATFDYDGLGERNGNRAVGIGEQPYFDPHSVSRTEVLQRGSVDGTEKQFMGGKDKSEDIA
ncbi:hypothetical protein MMC10_001705 [Thelotrema lepadinum]|nr:hypothetical protein [Thelotrema lepadinum]